MRFAIIRFPGTWSDRDTYHVLHNVLEQQADILWHRETDLSNYDAVVLPGGFSYGDYLRCGAIARFSPVMDAVVDFAEAGKPVIGICNGFQVLCESHLLPGALIRNQSLQFRCQWTYLRREGGSTPWADGIPDGTVLHVPISHGEGNYFADPDTLNELELRGRVVFRYCDAAGEVTPAANPNGSARNIAGIINARGNVLGMMPHPERAGEQLVGGADGNRIWESLLRQATTILAG
ncbi:MAG: phosphoribosylformylglycinamidine synthase subunit PurQ [Chloroflexi bacterium]|jgi:phosphoribosylformylglycinamidine synthase|nr:phosphoribosylformylglycinamidine synthase subunit PurQ [Dehalococcoidia bacterium]MCO5202231.1 phosphoribosylformylglycinamidine synthase subunit PurQ [Chloroflexota bacterium]NJD65076.1 phosphoribosylformylglycinamidine synthase subunit PurQ [Chloroflexota bacterium]PWB41474.1 MAG: phosphoribosylformylglycinamidine synthase I [Dehalococcoidia bacterium]